MSELIESIERRQLRREIPRFREGDRVRVHFQVIEGQRRRTQVFEGVVIRLQGSSARRTFTVRKLSFGVGVERTFPLHSPKVEKIEVAARGHVRRAKLYYLRGRIGRRARVRERRDLGPEELMIQGLEEAAVEVPPDVDADGAAAAEVAETEAAAEATADGTAEEPVAATAEETAETAEATEDEEGVGKATEATEDEGESTEPEAAAPDEGDQAQAPASDDGETAQEPAEAAEAATEPAGAEES